MKTRHAIIIFILGICFDFIGALFKLMHWAYGDMLLVIGTMLKVAGALTFLYKLLRYPPKPM